jgi:hypothetical protein
MGERTKHTESFQSGQNTNARGHAAERVPVKFKVAKMRNAGNPDPLAQTLIPPYVIHADTMHFHSGGKPYSPAGEYGRPKIGAEHKSKATNSMGGHGGKGTFRGKP